MRRATCSLCREPFVVSDGADNFLPFCSRRCKDADLNRWFTEAYSVPVQTERVVQEALGDLPPDDQ